jgi:hypothetical protein
MFIYYLLSWTDFAFLIYFKNIMFFQQQIPTMYVNALITKKRPEKHEVSMHFDDIYET